MITDDPHGHSVQIRHDHGRPGADARPGGRRPARRAEGGRPPRRADAGPGCGRPPGAGLAPAPDCGRMQEAAPGRTGQEATTR